MCTCLLKSPLLKAINLSFNFFCFISKCSSFRTPPPLYWIKTLFLVFNIATICSTKHGRFFDKKDAKELRAHGPSRRIVLEEPKDLLQRGHPGKPDPTDDVVNRGPHGFERNDDVAIGEERRGPHLIERRGPPGIETRGPPGFERRGPPGFKRRRPPAGLERRSELSELKGEGRRGPLGFERRTDLQNS